jgi:hypothetical protein
MVMTQQSMINQESATVQEKFPLEPERVIISLIFQYLANHFDFDFKPIK